MVILLWYVFTQPALYVDMGEKDARILCFLSDKDGEVVHQSIHVPEIQRTVSSVVLPNAWQSVQL